MSENFVPEMEQAIDRYFAETSPEKIAQDIKDAEEGIPMTQPPDAAEVGGGIAAHLQRKLRASEARAKELEAVLGYYANEDNYSPYGRKVEPVLRDGGTKAREALSTPAPSVTGRTDEKGKQ